MGGSGQTTLVLVGRMFFQAKTCFLELCKKRSSFFEYESVDFCFSTFSNIVWHAVLRFTGWVWSVQVGLRVMNAQTLALDGFFAPKTLKESLFSKLQKHVENRCFWADFQKIKIFNFFEKNRFCLFWEGLQKTEPRNLSKERVLGGYRAISLVEVGKRLWFWLVACFFKLKLVFWIFVKKRAHFLSMKALIFVFPLSLILLRRLWNFSQDEFGVYRLDRV